MEFVRPLCPFGFYWVTFGTRTEAELKFKSKSLSNLNLSDYLALGFKSMAYQNAV